MFKSIALSLMLIVGCAFGAEQKKSLDNQTKKNLLGVYEQYEELHKAFYKYDAKKAEEEAQELQEKIGKVKDQDVLKLLTFSKKKLGEIESEKTKKENKENFNLISKALIHVLHSYEVGGKYEAFHCGMAKKDWIQDADEVSEVQNPYMEKMPHCGAQIGAKDKKKKKM